ncbi:hypothetical protein EJB05_15213 [Eragrostis curvula]|uniref:Uncharacterized protein n=1 Tax=Eragrostis curvula TaxID=38414 RepID=A0A5J9W185_9POAL|nr:hypothetical protein EJB05_15213 [Eragrostis curvula]
MENVAGADIIPGECDEAGFVEEDEDHHRGIDGLITAATTARRISVWVCCADRQRLLSDLGRAEIATVGGRTRNVPELDVCDGCEGNGGRAPLSTPWSSGHRGVAIELPKGRGR